MESRNEHYLCKCTENYLKVLITLYNNISGFQHGKIGFHWYLYIQSTEQYAQNFGSITNEIKVYNCFTQSAKA